MRIDAPLEDISDWLTKILVGVGLTQLGSIVDFGRNLAAWSAPGLGDRPESGFKGVTISLYFAVLGFLLSYMWTRFYFTSALRAADGGGLRERLAKLERRDIQGSTDTVALDLITRQLGPQDNASTVTEADLTRALAGASDERRIQAYNQASRIRQDSWSDPSRKWRVAQTIPIWNALITSRPQNPDFRYFAELGFAQKDKPQPDYVAALKALSQAIRLRNERGVVGWKTLEFNRAICNIELAPDANADAILADLHALGTDPVVRDRWDQVEPITQWLVDHPEDAQTIPRPSPPLAQ